MSTLRTREIPSGCSECAPQVFLDFFFPGFFFPSPCLELPNPCHICIQLKWGKKTPGSFPMRLFYLELFLGSSRSVDPSQLNSLELGVAPAPVPVPSVSPSSQPLFLAQHHGQLHKSPCDRYRDQYPAVNDSPGKLGWISCLLLLPTIQTSLCPFQRHNFWFLGFF